MDRRFFTWLMLTSAMCFLYLSMRPQPEPEVPPPAAQQVAPNADPLLRPGGAGADSDANTSNTQAQAEIDASADPGQLQSPAPNDFPSQAITLGSMDPRKGYNLQVTLTTRGAGIEHAELVGQKQPGKFRFRALEHEGGYLGFLGLVPQINGLRVRTVPDGTPAALATCPDVAGGLQVDDVLTELNSVPIDSLSNLDTTLARTKPGQSANLVVERSINGHTQTLKFSTTLSEAPLNVLRTRVRASERIAGNEARPSLRTTLGSIEGTRIPPGGAVLPALQASLESDWAVESLEVAGGQGVQFRMPLDGLLQGTGRPEKLDLVKRYRLYPQSDDQDGYLLDVETIIVNRNDTDVAVSFRQEGLVGLTLEGWWYSVKISPFMFSGAGQRDAIYRTEQDGHLLVTTRQILDHARNNEAQPDRILFSENEPAAARHVSYMGLDSQYFNASILAHPDQPEALTNLRRAGTTAVALPAQVLKAQAQATNTSFWFDTSEELLPAGQELSQRYQVFIGPKDTEILAAHGLERAIEYGWFPWIAKPLSAILHFFHMIVGFYGLAIVMLTVMVRGLMFPLGRKAAMNAQRMQELQPELKKINDLHKDNMEKRAKAMQELYAKHNFKPLAGCLPMFIQLPIFIGLYRCLSVDTSLRQEPLLPGLSWCSNLAGPDMLFEWSSWMPEFIAGRGVGWLGPYFNILPMVTVGLFLLQQKMLMPKATDEQTRMTQNMMQIMTVFMGVLFFKVPSGLCIYFITSSLWSLVERRLVKRFTPATSLKATSGEASPPASPPPSKKSRQRNQPTDSKPPSRMRELMQLLEKPAVKSSTQRGPAPKPARNGKKKHNKKRR